MDKAKSWVSKRKPNGKWATGRPTKYRPEYCQDIVRYFETCHAEIVVDVKFFQPNKNVTVQEILNPLADKSDNEILQAGAVKSIDQKLIMTRFPTIVRYALSIGVTKETIYEWADKYKEFSDSLVICKHIAESILLENWLQWTFNWPFAMFLLKNNYGYKDKTEVDHTIEVKELTEEQQLRIAQKYQQRQQILPATAEIING